MDNHKRFQTTTVGKLFFCILLSALATACGSERIEAVADGQTTADGKTVDSFVVDTGNETSIDGAGDASQDLHFDVAVDAASDAYCSGDASQSCYTGPFGTQGVGECKAGTQICVSGTWSKCAGEVFPSKELCDSKDNDCDTTTDEDFLDLSKPCSVGVGECKATGVYQCKADGSGTECPAKAGAPSTETCDGKDNDCDGKTDEDSSGSPLSKSCYSGTSGTKGVGQCKAGIQTCSSGSWGTCTGEVLAKKESCNGLDDDCDGLIDEGVTDTTQACYTGPSGTAGVGPCKAGTKTCTSGVWSACQGQVLPSKEICDNKDNSCDGKIDGPKLISGVGYSYKYLCPSGSICLGGSCASHQCTLQNWNGHTYGTCATKKTWSSAASYCKLLGGYLVSPTSASEDLYVRSLVKGITWIGLSDVANEGVWLWESGEAYKIWPPPFNYSGWGPGEPNNQFSEDCGQYWNYSGTYKWNDGDCSYKLPFICEWDKLY